MLTCKVRTFSAPDETVEMLDFLARYHRLSKSATIGALIKKEFWRIFPEGTKTVKLLKGARIAEKSSWKHSRGGKTK